MNEMGGKRPGVHLHFLHELNGARDKSIDNGTVYVPHSTVSAGSLSPVFRWPHDTLAPAPREMAANSFASDKARAAACHRPFLLPTSRQLPSKCFPTSGRTRAEYERRISMTCQGNNNDQSL